MHSRKTTPPPGEQATIPSPTPGPPDPALRVVKLPNGKRMHMLPATLETTQWGWFDNAQPPVLRVNSGDTIVLETMMHSHNQVVPGTTIEQIKKTRTDFPGRGPHTLTGPIYIEEAQPGDVLKVTLNKIVPRAYATNFNVPGMFGQFPNVYTDGQVKYFYLDLEKMTTEFLPGIVIPLRPFPGTLAVARKEPGRYSSVPPGEFAGNMDIRDFVAGSSLYVPVHVAGRAAVDRRFACRPGQRRGQPHRDRDRLPGVQHHGRSHQGQAAGVAAHRDARRPGSPWASTRTSTRPGTRRRRRRSSSCPSSASVPAAAGRHAHGRRSPTVASRRSSTSRRASTASVPKDVSGKEDMERPTAETSEYYVVHVKDADFNKAMNDASMGMIKFLESEKKIARLDAYGLASVAMDCRVGAVSDTEKNVHCLMPKSIWQAPR